MGNSNIQYLGVIIFPTVLYFASYHVDLELKGFTLKTPVNLVLAIGTFETCHVVHVLFLEESQTCIHHIVYAANLANLRGVLPVDQGRKNGRSEDMCRSSIQDYLLFHISHREDHGSQDRDEGLYRRQNRLKTGASGRQRRRGRSRSSRSRANS